MDLKKIVGNKIKELRLKRGMNQDDLAEILGTTKQTVSRYEKGERQANQDILFQLSDVFKVSIDEFFPKPDNLQAVSKESVHIPILGEIACGDPIYAEENFSGYRTEPKESVPSGNIYYLQAKGDSMEPTIPNGSWVLIREQPDVENGEIAAVLVNGDTEATLKRIRKQGDTIILTPDNSRHNPIIANEENPVKIIGKAIRFTMDL